VVALEGTLDGEAEVLSLDVGESGELNVDVGKVETGNLLIENLGKDVDLLLQLAALRESNVLLAKLDIFVLVEHDLSKDLVGEAAGHDERAVASGTAEVDETTFGKEDDVTAVLHEETVNLGLDVLDRLSVGLEPGDVDFAVKVANV